MSIEEVEETSKEAKAVGFTCRGGVLGSHGRSTPSQVPRWPAVGHRNDSVHVYASRDRYTHLTSPQRLLGKLSGAPAAGYRLQCSGRVCCVRRYVREQERAVKRFGKKCSSSGEKLGWPHAPHLVVCDSLCLSATCTRQRASKKTHLCSLQKRGCKWATAGPCGSLFFRHRSLRIDPLYGGLHHGECAPS